MSRVFRKVAPAAAVLLLLACAAPASAAPSSDRQVVEDLTGANRRKAARAVHEVLARGGRMVSLLLKLKGDRRCFFGDLELGSHNGGSYRIVPDRRDRCYETSSASTVEVAALYLIEAVYRNDLKFAQGATLAEWKPNGEERTDVEKNGRELIARAWAVTEKWFGEFEREGLEALRAKERGPFAGTKLGFY